MCIRDSFKTKKLQMKILLEKSQIALRKWKSNTTALNAGVLRQQAAVERLIHLDEGFKFLRELRGSPLLWESKKRFFCKDKTVGSCNSLLQFLVCRNTVDTSSKNFLYCCWRCKKQASMRSIIKRRSCYSFWRLRDCGTTGAALQHDSGIAVAVF